MKLIAKEIVGEHAISMQSGHFLYNALKDNINNDEIIELDFTGVKFFASPFFNASIGYLLKDIPVEKLTEKIKITNLSEVGRRLLNLVIANAINFYKNKNDESMKIISKNADEI